MSGQNHMLTLTYVNIDWEMIPLPMLLLVMLQVQVIL